MAELKMRVMKANAPLSVPWHKRFDRATLRRFEAWCSKQSAPVGTHQIDLNQIVKQPDFAQPEKLDDYVAEYVHQAFHEWEKVDGIYIHAVSGSPASLNTGFWRGGLSFEDQLASLRSFDFSVGGTEIQIASVPIARFVCMRGKIRLVKCLIAHLEIVSITQGEIVLEDCWVGFLRISAATSHRIKIVNTTIQKLHFERPQVQYLTNIDIANSRFETKRERSSLFDSYQSFRGFRAYLEEIEDPLAAAKVRVFELRAQRSEDRLAARAFGHLYDFGSRYGENATRPIFILVALTALAGVGVFLFDGGRTPLPPHEYVGWRHIFLGSGVWERLARSLWLPFQTTFNPIGIFGYRQPVIAEHFVTQGILTFSGILNLGFLLMAITAIRKRFKLHN